jgi:hypothetical protein
MFGLVYRVGLDHGRVFTCPKLIQVFNSWETEGLKTLELSM